MDTGLAWALRETQGPAATPAAPAVSFRKSRRVAFDCAGLAMNFPLCETWMDDPAPGAGVSSRAARLVQPVFFFELPRQVGLGQVAEAPAVDCRTRRRGRSIPFRSTGYLGLPDRSVARRRLTGRGGQDPGVKDRNSGGKENGHLRGWPYGITEVSYARFFRRQP